MRLLPKDTYSSYFIFQPAFKDKHWRNILDKLPHRFIKESRYTQYSAIDPKSS